MYKRYGEYSEIMKKTDKLIKKIGEIEDLDTDMEKIINVLKNYNIGRIISYSLNIRKLSNHISKSQGFFFR